MRLPVVLGLAGLIPFWALALAAVTGIAFGYGRPDIEFVLAAYAATIASFLGGIRWGLSVRETVQSRVRIDYIVAVMPQLIGWAAMVLEGRLRLIVLAAVLLITGPYDYTLVARSMAPPWFGRLRLMLSLLASASLVLVAAA